MTTFLGWLNYLFGFSMPFSHIGGYAASGLAFFVSWYYWKKIRKDTFFLWLRLFLLYGFIRAFFSADPKAGTETMLGYFSHWFLPFVLGYAVCEYSTVKKAFHIYFITFTVLIMLSVLAFFGYFKPIFGNFQLVYEGLLKGGRSHIALAAILLMFSLFALGKVLFNNNKPGIIKVVPVFLVVFFLALIFLTGSRGYYIAAALTCLAAVFVSIFVFKFGNKKLFVAGIMGFILIVAGLYFKTPVLQKRIQRVVSGTEGSISERVILYKVALWEIKDSPVFGFGPNQAVKQRAFFEKLKPEEYEAVKTFGHLHSIYLQIAADFGLTGLVLFLIMIFTGLKEIWAVFTSSEGFIKGMAFGLFWGFIGVLLGDSLDTILRGPGVAMELFWFTGMLIGSTNRNQNEN